MMLRALVLAPLVLGPLPGGATVREQEIHGLRVRGGYEVERHGETVSRRIAPSPTSPPRRNVDTFRASELATASLGFEAEGTEVELVYLNHLGQAVLAWEITSPLQPKGPGPLRERAWLSARTGKLLARRPLSFDSRAHVYPQNPASTPMPMEIEFSSLDVSEVDAPLRSPTIDVFGCVDEPVDGQPVPDYWTEGLCVPHARARSDAMGDFFVPLPDVGLIADNEAFDDAYAEVAAYYYVERFFEGMAARGLDSFFCEQFSVQVNRYVLDEDGDRVAQGGASFVESCDPDVSPTLVIGQGLYADFAYDTDIIAHEMTHSVIQHLAPEGLTDRNFAPTGILSEAGALNEGIADYFAMSLAGDPELAEYIGRFSVNLSTPYIRTAINDKRCPTDIVGSWHSDGLIVSGALWAVRDRMGEVIDRMVLQTLPLLPPDATLDQFGNLLLESAAEMREAGEIDDEGFEWVERTLAGRGLLDCSHVIDDVDLATQGKRMVLIGDDDSIAPFAPGPLQLRYRVPLGETEVTIFFTMIPNGGEDPPAANVLVREGGEPITFEYALENDVVQVSGDWHTEVEAESLNGQDFIARIPVEPGAVLHVSLANRAPASASASNFFVVASEPSAADEVGGCGCAVPGDPSRAPTNPIALLALLGLICAASGRRLRVGDT